MVIDGYTTSIIQCNNHHLYKYYFIKSISSVGTPYNENNWPVPLFLQKIDNVRHDKGVFKDTISGFGVIQSWTDTNLYPGNFSPLNFTLVIL